MSLITTQTHPEILENIKDLRYLSERHIKQVKGLGHLRIIYTKETMYEIKSLLVIDVG